MTNYNIDIFLDILEKLEDIYKSGKVDELPQLISEVRKYEKFHKSSNGNWQAKLLYNITSEALIIIEKDIIIHCMDSFEKITGFNENELIGHTFLKTVHPSDQACISDFINDKTNTIEKYNGVRKDNTPYYAEITAHKIQDEKNKKYLLIRDISVRHRLEQKLRESETKFRNLANTTSVAIMIYQGEYWAYANPAAERISGYKEEELKKLKYWSIVAPEYRDLILQRGKQRQDGEDVPSGYEFKIISKDGKEKWVLLEGKLTIFNGKPAGLISIIDITHIKQIELNLKEKNKALLEKDKLLEQSNKKLSELNIELQERNTALLVAKEKAEESDRLKSAFLANMSHEIRTPMNAIMGFAELLTESENISENEIEFANTIYQRSQHLLQIINDIVDISKIEANLLTITKSEFELNTFLNELRSSFEQLLHRNGKNNIEIIISTQSPQKQIYTDKIRLEQILTNLVGNAIKFTNEGSITIAYKDLQKNKIQFTVTDTGRGIPNNQQDKIFGRFVMANDGTTDKQEGTGLGLAIAKSLSEILGGNIWINTAYKNGASFHFTIQNEKSKEESISPEPEKNNTKCLLDDKVILLIEDDIWNASYLHNFLSEKCAEVITCKSAEDGILELESQKQIDLILLDIKLPGMNGFTALPLLKSKRNIPVIAQTAYAFNEDRLKALAAGFDDYISKPIDGNQLLEVVLKQLK